MQELIEGEDYRIMYGNIPDGQGTPIYINKDPYKGVIVQYGEVNFDVEDEANPMLHFEYVVLANPNNIDEEEDTFRTFLGDMLVSVTENTLKLDEAERILQDLIDEYAYANVEGTDIEPESLTVVTREDSNGNNVNNRDNDSEESTLE